MKLRSFRLALAGLFLGLGVVATAQAAFEGLGAGELEFRAAGPAGLTIDGEGSGITLHEEAGFLILTAPLAQLKTGISLRDDHLRKALDTKTYPTARLTVERTKLKLPADNQEYEGTAVGQLTLHGVTKPTQFAYKAKRTGSDYLVQGRFEVDITQFNIEVPCYLGVCVDKTVKVKAKLKARDH
ncbi:MAG TPA: YceI family protein [Polyangiaceae bacterium]|nr:YceI family protein [Polyangiaceae bacterium]